MARTSHLASLPLSATLLAIVVAAPGADAPSVAPAANGAAAGSGGATAQGAAPGTGAATSDAADGGELALFEEMPVVVSASRRESRLSESSAPVSVVTADDIKYSGQRTIPDVLQFTPGVDVLTVDRNRPAVGVRGLHDHFSDRTLTLIDGRPAESPIYGGGEYILQPVFIDDVERIEVVRGPGGAVWGANAYNGVINIITKDPEHTAGVRAMGQLDSLGDAYSSLRWGEVHGAWAWRVSIGYDDRTASETITHAPPAGSFNGEPYAFGDDWSRIQRYDATGSYQVDNATRLRFGTGFERMDHGAEEFVLYQPRETAEDDVVRSFAKAEREFGGGTQASLQWSGEYERLHEPSIALFDSYVDQLDGQVDLREIGGHALTFGASGKIVDIGARDDRPQQASFGKEEYREDWYGAFLVDRWHVVDPLTIEAQARGDYYSGTDPDWAGRLAALYALDRDQNNILRLAVARAYRTPLVGLREPSFERDAIVPLPSPPFPPGSTTDVPVYRVVPADDVENEHTWSLEGGISSKPTPELLLRLDGFLQRYTDLIGFDPVLLPTGFPPPNDTFPQYQAQNHAGAWARGFEAEATWTAAAPWSARERIRLDAWYAFDRFILDHDDRNESIRAYQPPEHSIGAGARWFTVGDLVLNLDYRHTGITRDDPGRSLTNVVHVSDVLDASISWPFTNHASLMVGCDDILDRTGYPVEGLANAGEFPTPGRSFYMRGEITF